MKTDVIIIGAGMSGLTAAVYLTKLGKSVQIFEAADSVGGRIKTENHNGFLLDHGFQVLLTAYPECKKLLNYKALDLKPFLPGATVLYEKGQFEIADPFRRPKALFSTIFAPVGSLKDKANTFFLKNRLVSSSIEKLFSKSEVSTLQQLQKYGFSQKMIDRFYKPFFSGIFLENELKTSSRMFDFVMKMFSEGDAAIPAKGMQEIPKQLAAMLPENCIQFNAKVSKIEGSQVFLTENSHFEAENIIIATEATGIISDYKPNVEKAAQSVTTVYFEAQMAPTNQAIVVLNTSENKKWANNLVVLTNVSKEYAPDGKVLIAVSYNGITSISDIHLAKNMQEELSFWYGSQVADWRFLKAFQIRYALPNLKTFKNDLTKSEMQISKNLFVCGDYLLNGSINAAMKSGRLVAELISK